ncbi:AAA family ATPase [Vibrio diabolicus]|uniref:AAA family ATPase n=1 Tax=Vibrio diabolicus TaxID=50719 RepID=UPI0021606B57|nr:AAA family ATPase [Vibrio diabolicus]MCS0401695.1 AAA family ATPase [Vibrio diabolicus]
MANRDGRIPLNVLRLKELRKKLGLSQERLAEECFQQGFVVSIASIKRAESGANVLYRTASNLAEYFSVPLEDLLIDRASEPLLTNVSSSPPYFFIFAIEAKCDLTVKTLKTLLFSQNTTPIIKNRTFVLTWSIQELDEYVFERIRQLALQLQVALSASIRSFINVKYKHRVTELSEHPNAITPINEILVKIPWGEIAACPCFISSNCARPIKPFLTGEPDFNNWHLVSLHQSHTDCFVGRKLELEALNSGIKRWQKQEAGQTYCITGTAGIGKTSLLNQVIASLNRSSCLTTEIQILNHGSADLLSPQNIFTRAICSFTREDTDDSIRQQTVESSIPSSFHLCLYWLMGVALNESEKQLLNLMEFQTLKQTIEQSIPFLIQQRQTSKPHLIIVEDVHWADEVMLAFLETLLPHITKTNILLFLTFRQQKRLSSKQSWFTNVNLIELRELSSEESYELACSITCQQNKHINDCIKLAKGHPLYLRQTLLCSQFDKDVPESLEHLVSIQLAQLPAQDRQALCTASVLGQCFQLEQLREITRIPGYVPDKLVDAGLVKLNGDQYLFHHDLICNAVFRQIDKSQCSKIHMACAKWYENRDRFLYAVHINHAKVEGVFTVLEQTAKHYLSNYQFEKALTLIEYAIKESPKEQMAYALNMKGNCLYSMGRIKESIEVLEQAIHHTENDPERVQYYLDLINPYRLTDNFVQAMSILDQAQFLCERLTLNRSLCEIHSMRGNMLFPTGQLDECEKEHLLALDYSQRANCFRAKAKSLGGLGDCAYAQGKMARSYEHLTECLQLCEEHQLLSIETANRYMLATVMIYQLQSDEALKQAQHASNLAYLTANRRAEIVSRLTAAWIFLERNVLVQAENEISTALQLSKQLNAHRFVAFLLESSARLHWYQGKEEKALSDIDTALELVHINKLHNFIGPWLVSTKALICGDESTALSALRTGEAWLESTCVGHNYLRFYQQGIQVAWQYKQPTLLRKYRDKLANFTREDPHPWGDFYIEQANLMLALLDQSSSVSELLNFNQAARKHQMNQAQISVDELNHWLFTSTQP